MTQGMVFVPNGESRQQTAILLVGTADEFTVPQREIKATTGGFYISQRLADILKAETGEDPTDTSGNRAEKEDSEEENT